MASFHKLAQALIAFAETNDYELEAVVDTATVQFVIVKFLDKRTGEPSLELKFRDGELNEVHDLVFGDCDEWYRGNSVFGFVDGYMAAVHFYED